MTKFFASALALLTSACGRPEVNACETFITDSLKSPSSYHQVSVVIEDQKMTLDEYRKAFHVPERGALVERWLNTHAHGRRLVTIGYDAPNNYGVLLRDTTTCAFKTTDGKLDQDESAMKAAVLSAVAQRSFMASARSGAFSQVNPADVPADPEFPCCS